MSDLIDVDGLRAALEHACPDSEIETNAKPDIAVVTARRRDRAVKVFPHPERNIFQLRYLAGESSLRHARTPDPAVVLGSAKTWLDGAAVPDLVAAWPFVNVVAIVDRVEHDERIERMWQSRLAHDHSRHGGFIAAAGKEPRLRRMYPFTSMGWLGFRPTANEFYVPGPWVERGGDGRFKICSTSWDRWYGGGPIAVGEAETAVRVVVAEMDRLGVPKPEDLRSPSEHRPPAEAGG